MFARCAAAALLAIAIVAQVLDLSADSASRPLGLSLAFGAVFGVIIQRSRFCFFCDTHDLVERRNPRGALAILLALGVGAAGQVLVIGAWLPVPLPERLPPDAHIGLDSWALAVAALAFGLGMAISGSCISAHLYRLGEGSPTAPFAPLGTTAGFALGFLSWNPLYLAVISEAPAIWLPHHLGYAGTLGATFAALAVLALYLARVQPGTRTTVASGLRTAGDALFRARQPAAFGGIAVGALSAASYLRVGPLTLHGSRGSAVVPRW